MKLVTSKKQGGFTLVELVMVIVVIALLSAYIGPQFASLERQARISQLNKVAGGLAETIQVVKAISVAELDGFVAENPTNNNGLTAIDYDGSDTTEEANTDNANATILAGEDISTEYHYPKAIASVDPAGAAHTATDSILQAQVAFNSSVLVFRNAVADTAETIQDLIDNCPANIIDNDGDSTAANTFVGFENQTAAATATDSVTIYPCSLLGTEALSGATLTDPANTLGCFVRYNDAGVFTTALTVDTYQLPSIDKTTSGC